MSDPEEIFDLILSQREGEYWDFKEQPHADNGELVLDILAMANGLSSSNKYIIFGVTDPSKGCEFVSLPDQRKKQAEYIDLVRSLSFAGDNRPEISLQTHRFRDGTVDVLTIYERPNKPYYLSKDFRGVKANHIYTRVGDTNTPRNSSADYFLVEKMWRQRFGIDLPPSEKFEVIISDHENWVIDIGNKATAYYAPSPEYRILFSDTDDGWEVYSFFFINEKSFFGKAQFLYHSTILFELGYCYVDETRISIPVPKSSCLDMGKRYYFKYFEKDTLHYKFLELIGLRSLYASRVPESIPFIFYRDQSERLAFEQYLRALPDLDKRIASDKRGKVVAERLLARGHVVGKEAEFLSFVAQEYLEWSRTL